MKKIRRFMALWLMICFALTMAACGKNTEGPSVDWKNHYGIVVDMGEDKVTFTLSPQRSEGITQADLDEEIKTHNYFSARINKDGSITRVVTREYYDSLIGAITDITLAYPGIVVNSGDCPNFVFADYASDFKACVILTKSEKPDESEISELLWLMEQAKDYFAVTGQDVNQETRAYLVNAYTGEYLYGTTEQKVDEIDQIIAENLIKE